MAKDNVKVASSPYGPDDQIGALNQLTPASQAAVMARADGSRIYDLSVDYFVGMPSPQDAGDPSYQIYMSHTPDGTAVDDLNGFGNAINSRVCYSGDVIFMYTHTGTHMDSLNHFGVDDQIFNQLSPKEHLGSRAWTRNGVEQFPPIVARAVLLDIAKLKGVECLPDSYPISIEDCEQELARTGMTLGAGDVALIRTGRMGIWPDKKVMGNSPGLALDTARWLTARGIIVVGSDQDCIEVWPSQHEDNWLPGHCHFLAEAGVPMIEMLNLQELSGTDVNEFCLIAAPIRLRGATAGPIRPLALPLLPIS